MAQLIQPFNPNQVDPTQSTGGFPIGRHKFVIVDSEVKATKANDGGFLEFTLKIIEGPNANITGPYRLNLYNANSTTCQIAQQQLSALCHVTNQFQLGPDGTRTEVLHNIPFFGEVAPQKKNPEYTEIRKVFDINGNEPGKKGQSQPQQQQPQQQSQEWGTGNQQQQAWGNQPQQQNVQQGDSQAAQGWNSGQQSQQQPQQQGWNNQQQLQQQQGWSGNQQQQQSQPQQQQQPQQQGNQPPWAQQ